MNAKNRNLEALSFDSTLLPHLHLKLISFFKLNLALRPHVNVENLFSFAGGIRFLSLKP